jgi:vitamin B12 transporter
MKKLTILLITILSAAWVNAQVKLTGKVRDNRNHIIAGASIQVKNSYDGGVSDSTGHFSFKTSEKGTQVIVVTNVGYKPVEQTINIGVDTAEIAFILKEEISELKAVTVTAGSFEAGDKKGPLPY